MDQTRESQSALESEELAGRCPSNSVTSSRLLMHGQSISVLPHTDTYVDKATLMTSEGFQTTVMLYRSLVVSSMCLNSLCFTTYRRPSGNWFLGFAHQTHFHPSCSDQAKAFPNRDIFPPLFLGSRSCTTSPDSSRGER